MSEVGNFTESPRVLFSGRQTDTKLDFRVGFGEYVQCTVPNTNNTMEARTEDCIAMVPTGSRSGSVKVMSISTGKIQTRDQFRILPMPLSVINRLRWQPQKGRRFYNARRYRAMLKEGWNR